MRDRVLVYQRPRGDWMSAVSAYKDEGLLLGRDVFTRRERCYRGTERCTRVWTESEIIAGDYQLAGVVNDLER